MYLFIYNIIIRLYYFVASILSIFQPKAKKWVNGRKDLFTILERDLKAKSLENQSFIWFHCSSLGEFEQGRPLIENIKKRYPNEKILLTFFSPSGYEIRKNYPFADLICYLPLDTKYNVNHFLKLVNPSMVFWIKYEFWFHTLAALHKRKIPTFWFQEFLEKTIFSFLFSVQNIDNV
ncbi:MAG: hypothetical protein HC803_06550 [Saprospiraceae bacterium]|nr:hypothetical protein [Saprospiraceae bacterium]